MDKKIIDALNKWQQQMLDALPKEEKKPSGPTLDELQASISAKVRTCLENEGRSLEGLETAEEWYHLLKNDLTPLWAGLQLSFRELVELTKVAVKEVRQARERERLSLISNADATFMRQVVIVVEHLTLRLPQVAATELLAQAQPPLALQQQAYEEQLERGQLKQTIQDSADGRFTLTYQRVHDDLTPSLIVTIGTVDLPATLPTASPPPPLPPDLVEADEFETLQGQRVYQRKNRYYIRDIAHQDGSPHPQGTWKVFKKQGHRLERLGTATDTLVMLKE